MKRNFILISCLLFTLAVVAQEEEKEKGIDKNKIFVGGNFGFGLGTGVASVNLSPQVGYYFSNWFAAGAGVNGIYRSYKERGLNDAVLYKENYGVAGLNIFGRLFPVSFLFVDLQPELNYVWGKQENFYPPAEYKVNKTVPALLGGAGVLIPSGRGGLMIRMQHDLLQKDYSPYGNKPFLSFGYVMGL